MGELIPTNAQLPAHLQATQSAVENDALITTGGPTFPMISLRGRQFRLKKEGAEKVLTGITELKIVVLAATPNSQLNAKTYYEGEYTTGSDEAPDCSSADGVKPDGNATNPQATVCATCPKNAWGSATSKMTGKDSKACKDTKMLYFVAPDNVGGDIVALRVPTMSLRHLSKFARALSSRKVPVSACVTTINFVDSEYPEVEFGFGGYLDESAYNAVTDRIASDEVVAILQGDTYASEAASEEVPAPPPHVDQVQKTPAEETGDMFSMDEAVTIAEKEVVVEEPMSEIDVLRARLAALQGAPAIDTTRTTGVESTPRTTGVESTLAAEGDVTRDAMGRVWDARIDSSNQKITGKGVWARRKNISDELYRQVVAELTGGVQSEAPATTPAVSKSVFDMSESELNPETTQPTQAPEGDASGLDDLLSEWG